MKRTHHCNELRPAHIGQTVTLDGWVHSRRDLGGLIFIDVRDREGRTQTVFDPSDLPKDLFEQAAALRSECVVRITGKVRARPAGTNNPKIPTGEVEVMAKALELLNFAEVLPFPVDDPEVASKVNEELRLKYRYLDLRRPEMARNLRLRSKVATATRVFMDEQGFLEVETPILFKSTPEGAREFLVPNRREPGTFYALPQSPQQFKQILMVAGVERYYQIARCFRDEDQRADRQLEFTQIDIEMSFIEREDIYNLIEGLLKRIWKTALNIDVPTPFKRLSFREAIDRYGIDKPDTRFGMELADFTEEFRGSKFKIFSGAVANQGVVKAINAKGLACVTQGQMDTMTEYAKSFGAKGLAYIKVEGGEWKSPIVRFFSEAEKAALTSKLAIEEGDLILFAADQWLTACEILGKIRLYCAEVLQRAGEAGHPGRPVRLPLGGGFPAAELRQGAEPLVFEPSSLHRARRGGHPDAQDRPEEGPRPALRRGGERRGVGRRLNPYPSAGRAEDGVRGGAADSAGRNEAALRLHAGGLPLRRAAARRHRPRLRPADRDSLRHAEHPGRDCLPQDRQGHLPHDRVAFARFAAPVARPAHRGEGGEEGVAAGRWGAQSAVRPTWIEGPAGRWSSRSGTYCS